MSLGVFLARHPSVCEIKSEKKEEEISTQAYEYLFYDLLKTDNIPRGHLFNVSRARCFGDCWGELTGSRL